MFTTIGPEDSFLSLLRFLQAGLAVVPDPLVYRGLAGFGDAVSVFHVFRYLLVAHTGVVLADGRSYPFGGEFPPLGLAAGPEFGLAPPAQIALLPGLLAYLHDVAGGAIRAVDGPGLGFGKLGHYYSSIPR